MKEIVRFAMPSSPPIEYSDPGRPRPPEILWRRDLAREVLRTRPNAHVQFGDPTPRRRTLREFEKRQVLVEFNSRFDDRMAQQAVMDRLANSRERRIRPTLADLRARLERATR